MRTEEIKICYGVPDLKWATKFEILVQDWSGSTLKQLVASSDGITADEAAQYERPILGLFNLTKGVRAWIVDTESNREALCRQPTWLYMWTSGAPEYRETEMSQLAHFPKSISRDERNRIKLTYMQVETEQFESMTKQQLKDDGWHVCVIDGCDSKYGRIAFNDSRRMTRGLTAKEFYGGTY